MACQSTSGGETAPAVVAAVICLVSLIGCASVLVRKDQREVGPLSRGVMLPRRNPYPPHYRTAFACSLLLDPPCDGRTLRRAFPDGHMTGLPRSAYTPGWVRLCLFAGGCIVCEGRGFNSPTSSQCLLAQASQHLWLVLSSR